MKFLALELLITFNLDLTSIIIAGNWFAPCLKNSSKSHYPDCLDMPICPWCRTPNPAFPQGPDPTPPPVS